MRRFQLKQQEFKQLISDVLKITGKPEETTDQSNQNSQNVLESNICLLENIIIQLPAMSGETQKILKPYLTKLCCIMGELYLLHGQNKDAKNYFYKAINYNEGNALYYISHIPHVTFDLVSNAYDSENFEKEFTIANKTFYLTSFKDQLLYKAAILETDASSKAQYWLAQFIKHHYGILKTPDQTTWSEILKHYESAVESGHIHAAYRAGHCYEKGLGCDQDLEKAAGYYFIAAIGSHRYANRLKHFLRKHSLDAGKYLLSALNNNSQYVNKEMLSQPGIQEIFEEFILHIRTYYLQSLIDQSTSSHQFRDSLETLSSISEYIRNNLPSQQEPQDKLYSLAQELVVGRYIKQNHDDAKRHYLSAINLYNHSPSRLGYIQLCLSEKKYDQTLIEQINDCIQDHQNKHSLMDVLLRRRDLSSILEKCLNFLANIEETNEKPIGKIIDLLQKLALKGNRHCARVLKTYFETQKNKYKNNSENFELCKIAQFFWLIQEVQKTHFNRSLLKVLRAFTIDNFEVDNLTLPISNGDIKSRLVTRILTRKCTTDSLQSLNPPRSVGKFTRYHFELYKTAARQLKTPEAWSDLADCYYYGLGTQKNYLLAAKYYRRAIKAKVSSDYQKYAEYQLGTMHSKGQGIVRSKQMANHCFNRAMPGENQKITFSKNARDQQLRSAIIQASLQKAKNEASDQRKTTLESAYSKFQSAEAAFMLGKCHESENDLSNAKCWYEVSAGQRYAPAHKALADISFSNQDYQSYAQHYVKSYGYYVQHNDWKSALRCAALYGANKIASDCLNEIKSKHRASEDAVWVGLSCFNQDYVEAIQAEAKKLQSKQPVQMPNDIHKQFTGLNNQDSLLGYWMKFFDMWIKARAIYQYNPDRESQYQALLDSVSDGLTLNFQPRFNKLSDKQKVPFYLFWSKIFSVYSVSEKPKLDPKEQEMFAHLNGFIQQAWVNNTNNQSFFDAILSSAEKVQNNHEEREDRSTKLEYNFEALSGIEIDNESSVDHDDGVTPRN